MTPLSSTTRRALMIWLSVCMALVISMIILGGVTRLTESGLSIVEWKPISGVIPPLSSQEWMQEFEHYKHFPEYAQKHTDLTLSDFKFIYFMEYSHRLLGRILGLIFIIPFLYFYRSMPRPLKKRSFILLVLGAAQGFMGWFMVKSGLVNIPYVSHYRLAAHLMLALILLAVMISTLATLRCTHVSSSATPMLRRLVHSTFFVLTCTILYGAFVAGLRAGTIYNTFPLMGGDWIPFEWNFLSPLWLNFFENQATVQWMHRVLATFTFMMTIIVSAMLWRQRRTRQSIILSMLLIVQYTLGIKTVLWSVPIPIALLHQFGAVCVWCYFIMIKLSLKATPSQ